MSFQAEMYETAGELRGVASTGLRFAENSYDRERYDHALSLSARLVAALEGRSPDEVREQYEDNLAHISPLLGAESAVFRDGSILLIKREDDGLWAMPGGPTEVGETWAESAERELLEEANLTGGATRLLAVFDSRLSGSRTKSHMYQALFLVDSNDGEPAPGPETTDVGFFQERYLPGLSPGHEYRIPLAFKLNRGELSIPYFDLTQEA